MNKSEKENGNQYQAGLRGCERTGDSPGWEGTGKELEQLTGELELWNTQDEYKKIIDKLEALPKEKLTPELTGHLARAYNNLAQPGDAPMFRKALELLRSIEKECSGEHNWNFRMGYALYFLDREDQARDYFEKALELRPGDEDTRKFIEECDHSLAVPTGIKPFRRRVSEGWSSFLEGEGELRRMIDEGSRGDAILELCGRLLSLAFEHICFEIGGREGKYDLILTPEGDRAELMKLVYFKNHAPESVGEKWNIYVGRRPCRGQILQMSGLKLSDKDARVWVEALGNQQVGLSVYCEKLAPVLEKDEDQAYSVMAVFLDQVLGEVSAIRYIGYMDLLETPQEGESIGLDELPDYIQTEIDPGSDPCETTADELCQLYMAYTMEPKEDEEWTPRKDIFAGITTCYPILASFHRGDERIMNRFYRDGAVPGFFYYHLDGIAKDQILNLRDQAEQMIRERAGEGVTFIGGASGTGSGYLDFIAWDLTSVLDAAVEAFAALPMEMAAFQVFRRGVKGVLLKRGEKKEQP